MNEQPKTPARFRMPSKWIGIVEVINAGLLTLTGYLIGQKETILAIVINIAYAMGKNIVERARAKDPINDETP